MKTTKLLVTLLVTIVALLNAQNADSARKRNVRKSPKKEVTIDQIVNRADAIFDARFKGDSLENSFPKTKSELLEYTQTIKPDLLNLMQESYYDKFCDACEKEQTDSAVINAFKYIMIGGEKDEPVMWQVLIDNYGCEGNTANTNFLINQLRTISESRDNLYGDLINTLSSKYEDVIRPKQFSEAVCGYWMSIGGYKIEPDFVLKINNAVNDDGTFLLSSPHYFCKPYFSGNKYYYGYDGKMFGKSQSTFCDESVKTLDFAFATEKIKEGNTKLAAEQLESNRQFRANMHGKIMSSNASFGKKLGASFATELIGGLFDAFAMNVGTGSKTSEGYGIKLYMTSPKVMEAKITYRRVKVSSNGNSSLEEHKPNQPNRFVKWEESDSVIFISQNGKPMSVSTLSKDDPLLKKYNAINEKYNIKRAKYLCPLILGEAVGITCLTYGIVKFVSEIKEENRYGGETEQTKKASIGSYVSAALGFTMAIATPSIIENEITRGRRKAYDEINRASMSKMRKKAAEFSLQPMYNPQYNQFGMALNVKF